MSIENWLFLLQNLARMRPNFTGQPINFPREVRLESWDKSKKK